MTLKKPSPHAERLEQIKAAMRGKLKMPNATPVAKPEVEDLSIDVEAARNPEPAANVPEEQRTVDMKPVDTVKPPPSGKRHWIHRVLKRKPRQKHAEPAAVETMTEEQERHREMAARRAEVDAGLEKIFLEHDGKMPDLSRLQRFRSTRIVRWLVGLLVFLGLCSAAAWTGFLFWEPYRSVSPEALHISVQGPSSIALGREEAFEVQWSNLDAQPFAHAEIRLGLPHDFTPTYFDPPPSDKDLRLWRLGIMHVGSKGSIRFRGIFTGALGSENALQVIGTFRPTAYSKDLETLSTRAVKYDHTVLAGTLGVPKKAVAGDTVKFSYTLFNSGNQTMRDLVARVTYPQGFLPNVASSSTKQDVVKRTLMLPMPEIPAGTTRTVEMVGTFVSGSSGDVALSGEVGRLAVDGSLLVAQRTDAQFPILSGDLTLHFVANGSDADRSMLPGEPLRLAVAYQNTSPEMLKDVALTVAFESVVNGVSATGTSLLDWSKLENASRGVTSTKTRLQTVTFTKDQVPGLAGLAPQSEGTIELAIPTLVAVSGTKEAVIKMSVLANVPTVGETKVNRIVRAQPIAARYRSDVDLAAEARAFTEEGAPLGFGPLPPVAGKTTAYRVFWHLGKTLHAVQGITVVATLPKIAAWSAKFDADAGTVSYDETTRQVKWTLNEMPENVGDLEANFEVQLTPDQLDIGRFAALLGESRFEAKDAAVEEAIIRVKPAMTTDLQNDEGAKGKGVVKKE